MKPYGIVYLTSRIFRGEVVRKYVGQHKLTDGKIEDSYLGSGNLLLKAIRKYGRGCFIREVLEICYSHQDLYDAEKRWVEKLDAVKNPLFYNIAEGGDATIDKFKCKVYQYTLDGDFVKEYESFAAAFLETGASSIPDACRRKDATSGGFQWKRKKFDKIPKVWVGKPERPVQCFDFNGNFIREYSSPLQAEAVLKNVVSSNICACCAQRIRSAAGFQWKYSDDPRKIGKLVKIATAPGFKRKVEKICPVSLEVIEVFDNLKLAAKDISVNANSVRDSCKKGTVLREYRWNLVGDPLKPQYVNPIKLQVEWVDAETDEVKLTFSSLKEANKHCDASAAYRIQVKKIVNGHYYRYKDVNRKNL